MLDPSGLVLETNPAAEKLTGFSAETVGTKLPPSHPLMAFIARDTQAESTKPIIHFEAMEDDFRGIRAAAGALGPARRHRRFVLRDVTVREATQKSLADAGHALKLRLEETCACRNSWNSTPFTIT